MAILSSIRKEGFGAWKTVVDFLNDAFRRDAGALAGMAEALSAPPADQKELGEAGGLPVLLSIACDLRLPKGARLGATRCALECAPSPAELSQLFIGAGDLTTDPRLGSSARRLVESGLPAALSVGTEQLRVSMEAAGFARAAHAAGSVSGRERVRELLAQAPPAHAGAAAALFALGFAELPAGDSAAWKKLLFETCAAFKRAPAAAKRMGLAPIWPPYLPDAFAPLIAEAEQACAQVVSQDALASPPRAASARPVAVPQPGRPASTPVRPAPAQRRSPTTAASAAGVAAPGQPPAAKAGPAIRRATNPGRPGQVDAPVVLPPRAMPAVAGRASAGDKPPEPERPRVTRSQGESTSAAQVPGVREQPLALQFDQRGSRIPRADRWNDDAFEWELPILPEPSLRPIQRAAVVQGPFAARLASLFEDRPEALDRLCAAAEVRAALRGEDAGLAELEAELSRPRWEGQAAPQAQLARLRAATAVHDQPGPWKRAVELLVARLTPPDSR